MDQTINSQTAAAAEFSDQRLTEIKYHRKLNRHFVLAALPCFVFFALFHFFMGNLFPGTLFTLLAVNAGVTYLLGLYIKDLNKLVLLKRIGTAIAFTLLAAVLVGGLFSKDLYIIIPWIFIYPVGVLLMFGERIGIFFAWGFCIAICAGFLFMDLPAWTMASKIIFRSSSAFALIISLIIAQVAERTRVRMRNELLEARNKYMAAEERQRLTNEELKVEIEMRIKSEKLLSQSEIRYRALFEESAVSLWEENFAKVKCLLDNLPRPAQDNMAFYLRQNSDELIAKIVDNIEISAVNRATFDLYEAADMEELIGNIWEILPENKLEWAMDRIIALYGSGRYQNQVEAQTLKGRKLNLLVNSTVPAGYETTWEKVYTSVNDITERVAVEEEKKQVENQAQHTRQIQAIATLAGGIAHQFNNALAVIVGNLDLLELKLPDIRGPGDLIASLRGSSDHMSRLTKQLLAYAKGGKYQPTDFPVERLISDYLESNRKLRKSDIQFTVRFEKDVMLAQSDLTQITSVLEAVLFNAVEASGESGNIIISTCNLIVDETHDIVRVGLAPGSYALITVEDYGVGMDEETRQRIFDPFFSTKFVGRGMGMAAAYGIICNHNGRIDVQSELGKGTRVMIYLPNVNPIDHGRGKDQPAEDF